MYTYLTIIQNLSAGKLFWKFNRKTSIKKECFSQKHEKKADVQFRHVIWHMNCLKAWLEHVSHVLQELKS
jgi:hypothetical protein